MRPMSSFDGMKKSCPLSAVEYSSRRSSCVNMLVTIVRADDRPLLCLLAHGILRPVDKVDDGTSLAVVEAVCLIHDIHDGAQEAHDLIDDEIGRRGLIRAYVQEEIDRRRRCLMVFPVDPLEILELLRLLRPWEEILPCAVAESKGELHRLRCNADVHRPLNCLDAISHVGDDLIPCLCPHASATA